MVNKILIFITIQLLKHKFWVELVGWKSPFSLLVNI